MYTTLEERADKVTASSLVGGLIGRRIDRWDVVSALSFIVPIVSLINPDIDDGFALITALIIFLANRALHSGSQRTGGTIQGSSVTDYHISRGEVSNQILNIYLGKLREKLLTEGYTGEQVEAAISLRRREVSRSVDEAVSVGIKGTVMSIVQNNLSPSGSYFTSPFTGKKYAFIFGSMQEMLAEFVRDDYRYILKESFSSVMEILRVNTGG